MTAVRARAATRLSTRPTLTERLRRASSVARLRAAMSSRGYAIARPATGALFGQVMFLVALACGTAALGAYVGRDMGGPGWFIAWLGALACFVGLNVAASRAPALALALLLGSGFLIGLSVGATIDWFAENEPQALWQAA